MPFAKDKVRNVRAAKVSKELKPENVDNKRGCFLVSIHKPIYINFLPYTSFHA